MNQSFNPFARHMVQADPSAEIAAEQQINSKPVDQPKIRRTRKSPPAPRLLYWLQRSWAKPIISLSQIVTYGPGNIRTREKALAQAELLEQTGWLIPAEDLQYEHRSRVWRTHPVAITTQR
jgi:hypothetical protein